LNRAFISLYLFLVISIVVIGWGLNHLWDSLSPKQETSDEIKALIFIVEKELVETEQVSISIQEILTAHHLDVEILSLDDIAKSNAMQQLSKGDIVAVNTDNQLVWYKRIANSKQVISLIKHLDARHDSSLYNIMLLLFYLALALVIYLWVWPLSRDAKKLEQQTQFLGKDQVPEELTLSTTSTLYPLARSFNNMSRRLQELIASHHDMTNAVSHELRTPLARMKFALAMVDLEKLDEKSKQHIASLEMDISDMESLINSLLVYAGFEQQTQQLSLTQGCIGDLLEHIEHNFHRSLLTQKLQLQIQDKSEQELFCCEWKLIETALQNLLSNAARFAVKTVRLSACTTSEDYLLIVEDDGPGIPAESRQRVTESFVRLYDEHQSGSGFGLGLAIVKRIMQWHKGGLVIKESIELGGAKLILHWPKLSDSYQK
jgi:two-component system, OmpR family, sensor kinase